MPEDVEEVAGDPLVASDERKLTDLPGIGPGIAAKLEAAGVFDLMGLAVMGPSSLADIAGVGEGVARKAIQAARGMLNLGFMDGSEFERRRKDVHYITTGSKNLDALLGGRGIESKAITEAYGAFGSGKCVSKDTDICYFNDTRMHVEPIEQSYQKYKAVMGESSFEEGQIVPLSSVKVMTWVNGAFKVTPASHLYRERVKQLYVVKTRRGRVLTLTGKHQLLSFSNGVCWKPAEQLHVGDILASPSTLDLTTEQIYDEDDAYFLGLFVAEGTANPFSITIGSETIKDWVCSYIQRKFGYCPTVRDTGRHGNPVYLILLRNATTSLMDGLDRSNSATKFIPEAIFLSSPSVVGSFLGGYLDGDGAVSDYDVSATTKSKRLATQLTYLFLRLGISSTLGTRTAGEKKETYFVVRVCGEDRQKLSAISFKLKRFSCSSRNSSYGYPRVIISFIGELYKESMGGNRGNLRKLFGKRSMQRTLYSTLIGSSRAEVTNSITLDKIEDVFAHQRDLYVRLISTLEGGTLSSDMLRSVYPFLPFAFTSLAHNLGVKKKTMQNYYARTIPETKQALLRNLIINELKTRVDTICLGLELMAEIRLFSWDSISSIDAIDYNDFVYDFVVPEGHSFIGGNMPTMMHNTQLGLTLAVNVQRPKDQGGAEGKAVFIDTEGTFRPERIKQIAEGIGAQPDKVLKNILVARAFNSDHQMLLLDKIGEMIKAGEPIKLMVIDSLTAHFRAEFSGRGQLADRQQRLNRYLHNLMKLAEQHNIVVYVTNQVMANPAMMFGDPTTAIGGNIVGHACLTGDSLIQLSDGGVSEIRNMKQQPVISASFDSMSFKPRASAQVFTNPDVFQSYTIKTNSQITCSPLHRFFSLDGFAVVEKEAKDLRVGDFVAQASKLDFEGENIRLPAFKLRKIGKLGKESATFVKKTLKDQQKVRMEICKTVGITPRQLRRVLNQEWPTSIDVLNNLQQYSGNQVLEIIPVASYKHRNFMMPTFMTPALAQIFGYFIGDGNLENRALRFRDARYEVLDYYNQLFVQTFGLCGRITKVHAKNCYSLSINSKEITDLFALLLPSIYTYLGKSKVDVVNGFIKGFVDAEGHIDKKRACITISQKNPTVLKYIQLFLLRSGIRSTIKFGIGRKKIAVLRIIDSDVRMYTPIGFTASDKQKVFLKKVKELEDTYTYQMMPVDRHELSALLRASGFKPSSFVRPRPASYHWVSRKELERSFYALMNSTLSDRQIKQKVDFMGKLLQGIIRFEKIRDIVVAENKGASVYYDFSVPVAENYVANGFIVHNSTYRLYLRRGKAGSRVAKLIDSPNLPDNEAQFFVTGKGLQDEAADE